MKEECFICEGFTTTNKSWLFEGEIINIYNEYKEKVDGEFEHNPPNQSIKTYESKFIPKSTIEHNDFLLHVYAENANNPICIMCYSCIDLGIQQNFFKSSYSLEGIFSKSNVLRIDFNKIKKNKTKWNNAALKVYKEKIETYEKEQKSRRDKKNSIKTSIIDLLTKKSIKMTISDITAHIKHNNRNHVKRLLEGMHKDGDIDFAGNGRYFILSDDSSKPKTKATSSKKTDATDVKAELKKYKEMLDEGLIEKEDFDSKKKQLLGL